MSRQVSALMFIVLSMLMLAVKTYSSSSGLPATEWSKTYGGADDDRALSVVWTSDEGYAIAGHTKSYGAGGSDFWLVKTDSSGILEWNKTCGGPSDDFGRSLIQSDDGGFAMAGYTESYGVGDFNFWLVKTDSLGNTLWNKTYGEGSQAFSLIQTNDGGYAITGDHFVLVKTDMNGTMEWSETYGAAGSAYSWCLIETSDGGYAITGGCQLVDAEWNDFRLVKTDSFGNLEWNKTYGGLSDDFAYSLVQTIDGGYAIAGRTGYDYDSPDYDFWLVKTDANGNMEWNKTYGRTDNDRAYSVLQTSDGGYALVGRSHFWGPERGNSSDIWFIKVDRSGDAQWNKTFGGADWDWAWSFVQTSDGGYTIAGYTMSFGAGDNDFWLFRVAAFTYEFDVVIEDIHYGVLILSNSTISDFNFKKTEMQINLNVTGNSGTTGYCNVTIPNSLLTGNPWTIKIDNTNITNFYEKVNGTHTFLYFTYTHESPLQVTIKGTWVIPEFPSAIILPLFMIFSLIVAVFVKLRMQRE